MKYVIICQNLFDSNKCKRISLFVTKQVVSLKDSYEETKVYNTLRKRSQ